MTTKIQEIALFLSGTDIRNITGLSPLSIPDGLMDDTQKAILATYAMGITEDMASRFPSTFWDDWGAIFEDGDSEPFADGHLDMSQYTEVVVVETKDEEPPLPDSPDGDQQLDIEKPDAGAQPEKQAANPTKTEPEKSSPGPATKKEEPKPATKRKAKAKSTDVSEALFHLIPAEKRLDIMLANVSPEDFGSLTKDQLIEITKHSLTANKTET
jgi:hypothetical protein